MLIEQPLIDLRRFFKLPNIQYECKHLSTSNGNCNSWVGELVGDYGSPRGDLRKLHPHGGSVALRSVDREIGLRRRNIPLPVVDDDALALRSLAVRVKCQPTP